MPFEPLLLQDALVSPPSGSTGSSSPQTSMTMSMDTTTPVPAGTPDALTTPGAGSDASIPAATYTTGGMALSGARALRVSVLYASRVEVPPNYH